MFHKLTVLRRKLPEWLLLFEKIIQGKEKGSGTTTMLLTPEKTKT